MCSSVYIETQEQLDLALQQWKNFSFKDNYMKLEDAANAILSEDRALEARRQFAAKWLLTPKGSKREAIFHTAGVWRWNSPLETGNYVPTGQTAPARLAESRIQSAPNNLCQFSYAIDTRQDKSIWDALKAFETFIQQEKDFNEHGKDRREWMSGKDGSDSTFVLTSRIFCKRTPYTRPLEAGLDYPLHPWIAEATRKGTDYFANPDRPTMLELVGGELKNISDCEPPFLRSGDLVWISFSVEFFIGGKYWNTNFIPYEFVRVGKVSTDILGDVRGFEVEEEDYQPKQRLTAGIKVLPAEDFPMFQSLDPAPPASNEVRFGPQDEKYVTSRWSQNKQEVSTPSDWSGSELSEPTSQEETAAAVFSEDGLISPTAFLHPTTALSPMKKGGKRQASTDTHSDPKDRPPLKIKVPGGRSLRSANSIKKGKSRAE